MTLTPTQERIYAVLTDEPRRTTEVGRLADCRNAGDHLMALKQKNLVRKHLNPTRWTRIDHGE